MQTSRGKVEDYLWTSFVALHQHYLKAQTIYDDEGRTIVADIAKELEFRPKRDRKGRFMTAPTDKKGNGESNGKDS